MEWPEFLESSDSHEPTFDMFDDDYPEVTAQAVNKWTLEEKQFFERAFAMYYNQDSETLFEFVASKLPHKSMEEIKNHYLTLCQGIEMENNPPKNKDVFVVAVVTAEDDHLQQELPQEVATLNGVPPPQVQNNRPRRRRGIPWTQGEHQLFLMGLNRYGKGDWKSISRYYVVSKTPTQVASHAQKYFSRRNSKTPMGRRRASINDIQTVNLNPRTRPASTVATTTHDQIINHNAGGFAAYNNNHQAELSFHYPLGDPTFSNNNNVNGNFGRFYGGEASGSNSFVMGQNNVNNNNINLPRPVSPRPFLSTYLSSKGV